MFTLYTYYKLSLKDLQGGIRDFFACFLQILDEKINLLVLSVFCNRQLMSVYPDVLIEISSPK